MFFKTQNSGIRTLPRAPSLFILGSQTQNSEFSIRTPPWRGGSEILDDIVMTVPAISTLPGPHDYRVQGLPRLWSCGSWCLARMPTLGLREGVCGDLPATRPKFLVETTKRDGPPHQITVSPMRSSSNLLKGQTRADGGKLHFGAALIHPLGVSMYSVRRVPAWPSTYPFPQGRMLAIFFSAF